MAAIRGEVRDTGTSGGGSHALGDVHNEVREDKRKADIRLVTATVQRIVDTLVKYSDFTPMAVIMADEIGLEMGRADRDAVVANKLGYEHTEQYMLDRYDYRPGDIQKKAMPAIEDKTSPNGKPNEQQLSASMSHPPTRFTAPQQAIEDGIDEALKTLAEPLNRPDLKRDAMLQELVDLKTGKIRKRAPKTAQVIEQKRKERDLQGGISPEQLTDIPRVVRAIRFKCMG